MTKSLIVLLLLLLTYVGIYAQNKTIIKGVVTDVINNEPLSFANVVFVGFTIGTTTDSLGKFQLQTDQQVTKLCASYLGYKADTLPVDIGKTQVINFKLSSSASLIKEMVFVAKKKDYKNKDNPAVELIKKVIENKSKNMIEGFDYYECEKYQKIVFGVSNISEHQKNQAWLRKVKFIFNNVDTTKIPGKEVLPIYINEIVSDFYFRKSPPAKKEIEKGNKRVEYAGFIDDKGIEYYLNYIYQDIDIYKDNIYLLTNQFVSPINPIAPVLYRFYITDTVKIGMDSCIKLAFYPRNKEDFLFQGYLYVIKDSTYGIKKVDMSVNKDINLNWVKTLRVIQSYERKNNQGMVLSEDFLGVDFGIAKEGLGIYGEKFVSYKNPLFNSPKPDEYYKGISYETLDDAANKSDEFWQQNRQHDLSNTDKGIYTMLDSLKKVTAYKRDMKILELCVSGYPKFGDFEIGPVFTFYDHNPVEGSRVKFGARTSTDFSNKITFEGYGAYGFQDMKSKYYGGMTYSLTKRNIYQFPVSYFKFSYLNDLLVPGQALDLFGGSDLLLAFKRGINDKMLYNAGPTFTYYNEFKDHFSYQLDFKNTKLSPAGSLYFFPVNYDYNPDNRVKQIQTSTVSLALRYAPNEKFYQGKTERVPLFSLYPTFNFRFSEGIKGVDNGQYIYRNFYASISKSIILAPLGFTNILIEGGQLFGTVPYPLLLIQRANQTYAYESNSYNLMNFMEFVGDRYVSIDIDHYFNGFIMNRIPFLKKLKLRETISLKALMGSITSQNNPANNANLLQFPANSNGIPITYALSGRPYIEGGVGIGNILKIFRIDLIRRFTYLGNPNVSKFGIRLETKIEF